MPLQLQTLFGPVPSRRLGRSLGIDVIPPKTCTYDCVYCESGRTTDLTVQRKEHVRGDRVIEDLGCFFGRYPEGADVLTFSSAGEPTLHLGLGDLIPRIKAQYPSLPVVVLTNGSLLWDPDVRSDLMRADRVVPSLDAVTPAVFKKLDRPHPSLDLRQIIEGLYAFRRDYRGQLHVEILFVRGINDDPGELTSLRRVVDRVKPDCVELNTVARPPACPGVRGLTSDEMAEAARHFPTDTCRIIGRFEGSGDCTAVSESLEIRVLQLVTRRPCGVEEMADSLSVSRESLCETLSRLENQEKIIVRQYADRVFYCPTSRSQCTRA